jgi:ribosome-binding factor A
MHKEKTQRQKRIEKRIYQIISTAFNKSSFVIGGKNVLVGINKIDISPDFRNVSIYIDIANIEYKDKEMVAKELNKSESIKTIKTIIAKDLNLRVAPVPFFIVDKDQEKKDRVSSLIENEAKKYKV